jgi:hypothetical protein
LRLFVIWTTWKAKQLDDDSGHHQEGTGDLELTPSSPRDTLCNPEPSAQSEDDMFAHPPDLHPPQPDQDPSDSGDELPLWEGDDDSTGANVPFSL